MRRIALLAAIVTLTFSATSQRPLFAQAAQSKPTVTSGPSQVQIGGAVTMPFTLSLADMKTMPRKTVSAANSHSGKTEVYEGVPLAAVLQKAGAPQGEQIRGQWLAAYVMIEAADNYRVVFSLAELDPGFLDSDVLLADTMDGLPIAGDEGPFKLVAPHEKRPARWIRMVKSITVVRVPQR